MVVTGPGPGSLPGVSIGFVIVSGVVVAMRICTRVGLVRHAGIDDACIVLALLFSIAVTITMIGQVDHGIGRDLSSLPLKELVTDLRYFWSSIWLYNLTICFTKLSMLFQYTRIWSVEKKFLKFCWASIAFVIALNSWTVFGSIWLCIPAEKFWNLDLPGHCQSYFANFYTNAGLNIVTDIILIALPMPLLKTLQMPRRQKIAVMLVFALGSFVCVVSFIRLRYIARIAHSSDPTRDNVSAATWSVIEINVGIVCACLPSLKAFVSRVFPRFMSTNNSYGTAVNAGTSATLSAVRTREGLPQKPGMVVNSAKVWARENVQEVELVEYAAPRDMEDGQIGVVTVMEREYEECRSSHDDKKCSEESQRKLVSARSVERFA